MTKACFFGTMAVLALACASTQAHASCLPLPYNLTNGTPADATQVMGDFNGILACPLFSGNVGIGVTSPGASLEVWGAAGTPTYSASNLFNPSGTIFAINASGGNGLTVGVYGSAGTYATWLQSGFQGNIVAPYAMLLNPFGGNVGVGTSAPSMLFFVNGQAGGTTAWSNVSDARLKRDVVEIHDALDLVEHLRGVRFHWLPAERREVGTELALPVDEPQVGFVAQEVAKVVPEAVTAPRVGTSDLYTVKDAALIPVMLEAMKEQQAEIVALKGEVAELQRRK